MSSEAKIQEEQFATILMELTMQYANLTDAHTFLLIETESSRRYAGKQHLKDLYKRGELKPCGRDSEISIDPSLSQMVEVSHEEDEENASSDLESLPRRHIGELPSERKQRVKNERKTYHKFVNMTHNVDESFATFLMEALMKYSCMTDASIFFLVETRFARRFTGKAHLCELYLEGALRPTGDDVEVELDPAIKVVSERRLNKPKDGSEAPGDKAVDRSQSRGSVEAEREENGSEANGKMEDADNSDRRRNESEASLDSSDKPVKRKHVGLLPSERREQKRQTYEGRQGGPSGSTSSQAEAGDSARKHKGELPSERRERLRKEREVKSGPGFIFGPSTFPSSYDSGSAAAYPDGGYGWGAAATGFGSYEGGFGGDFGQYGDSHSSGYKSSYSNWKSGGTMYGGESTTGASGAKTGKSNYGW